MNRFSRFCSWPFVAVAIVACSSSPALVPDTHAASESTTSTPPAPAPTSPGDLPVPSNGFQVHTLGADIAPGEDVEYCEIGELPGDPSETYYAVAVEIANGEHSHHMVVSAATPGSVADGELRQLSIGDKVTCNGATYQWPEDGLYGLATAQIPYTSLVFPDGVGTILHGGQRMVYDYHYFNSTDAPIRAESAVNVHTADSAAIKHLATAFSYFNFTVDVPPNSTASFTSECHFKDDLMVASLLRHTHQQGRDFSVWYSGGAHDGQHIWTSHDWKSETQYEFAEPILVKAGEGFRFQCVMENQSPNDLRYGIRATDEMCILAGWVWPGGDAKELPPPNCMITWTDRAGIAHPADEAGGFPPATAQNARICLAGLKLSGPTELVSEDCSKCVCDACGDVLLSCAADTDCSALLDCFTQDCGTQSECVKACKEALHDHSSAVGMLQQVQGCLSSRCDGCGPKGG